MPASSPSSGGAGSAGQVRAAAGRGSYIIVFFGLAAQNLILLGLSMILASYYGTSAQFDAYNSNALAVPLMFGALFAGTLGPILITSLNRPEPGVDLPALTGLILGGALATAAALAAVGALFSEPIMAALHRGDQPEFLADASRYFRILVWLIPLNTLIGLFQSILNARLHFATPATAGIVGPLVTVGIMLAGGRSVGVERLAWATLAGAAVSVGLQLPIVWPRVRLRGAWGMRGKAWSLGGLAVPILLGTLLLKVDPVVDRDVCSTLDAGTISRLRYAGNLVTVFVALASGTLSTVSFPRIARNLAAAPEQFAAEVRQGLRVLILLCLPGVAALSLFPEALVRDLLERGTFTAADTAAVAGLLRLYSVMFAMAALGELCAKTFYSLHDSVTPHVVGSTALLAGFAAKFLLVPERGVATLVAITSTVYLLAAAGQLALIARRLGGGVFESLAGHALRCGAATLLAAAAGWTVWRTGWPLSGLCGLVLGAAVYFPVMLLLDAQFREAIPALRRALFGEGKHE